MVAQRRNLPYQRPPELDRDDIRHVPVLIVGGGPVGLTAALDLARKGQPSLLLDRDNQVSDGSRAICFAKRTLEIYDRLGIGSVMREKGVQWNVGRIFFRDEEIYDFDLLPVKDQANPAFINLQQYYQEEFIIDALADEGRATLRWGHEVTSVDPQPDHVLVTVKTPDGVYQVTCDWMIAADGAHSPVRRMLGLDFEGRIFEDHFLIADVRFKHEHPNERWFWFDPPFNPGQSALMHKQPDDVWRLDFQLGWDVDREKAKEEEYVTPLVRGMLGRDVAFEYEWISVYTFQCRRLERFVHGRVIFAGDAAHLVSPFGARGANSGIQDADNLCWKLDLVLRGRAPESLLDSYNAERTLAADENILNSSRATDFITPKTPVSRAFRDGVLELSRNHPGMRGFINSGRLSVPAIYDGSPLNFDGSGFAGRTLRPGGPCLDAPVIHNGENAWLLSLLGDEFRLLCFADSIAEGSKMIEGLSGLKDHSARVGPLVILPAGTNAPKNDDRWAVDAKGLVSSRYDGSAGRVDLIRPDQHIAARYARLDVQAIGQALDRASGQRIETLGEPV